MDLTADTVDQQRVRRVRVEWTGYADVRSRLLPPPRPARPARSPALPSLPAETREPPAPSAPNRRSA